MRQPLVAGNWKMHGTPQSVETLVDGIVAGVDGVNTAEVAVCPPYVFLADVGTRLAGVPVALGAQNVSEHEQGAYTGGVSVDMLNSLNCTYVIVGHSERRALYGESDELVAAKYVRAQSAGITPIICVGETLEQRESGATEATVARQLEAVIALAGADSLSQAVIAYEPVWAIGTGKTATPEQANDVHRFIRERVAAASETAASAVRILYGGSVKAANAEALLAQPDVDGGLIGGASLMADEFLEICKAAG